MFDDLDDPSFAGPGAGARDAVAARAGRIRRNRRLAWTSGVASVVLMVVALTAVLRPGTRGLAGVEPLQPSPFASVSESATPTPSATAAESPTPTPGAVFPTASYQPPGDEPSSSPSPEPQPQRRDRIGAWLAENSIYGCAQATELPDPGQAPHPAVTMTLDVPDVVDADEPGRGKITFTNTSSDVHAYFAFYAANSDDRTAGLLQTVAAGGGEFSGVTWWRAGPRHREDTQGVNIGPGESISYGVEIITETCDPPRRQGETYDGAVELLAPGTYQMSVGIYVFEADIIAPEEASPPPGCCARWASTPVTVTVR